jgi:hypothetical protein
MLFTLNADHGTAFDRNYVNGQVEYQKGKAARGDGFNFDLVAVGSCGIPRCGPDLRGNSQAPNCYGCFSSRNVNIAEARSTGFSRKDKCPEGISALFAVGIKSANS